MRHSALRARIEERAGGRCEYCQAPQRACGYRFHLEHIIPVARGGSDDETNRALACASCNLGKADRASGRDPLTGEEVLLFDPRTQVWRDHFAWAEDQRTLTGLTATGRAITTTLDMNSTASSAGEAVPHGRARSQALMSALTPDRELSRLFYQEHLKP